MEQCGQEHEIITSSIAWRLWGARGCRQEGGRVGGWVQAGCVWGACGLLVGCRWGACGVFVGCLWGACGMQVGCLWGACGMQVGCRWGAGGVQASGVHMGCRWDAGGVATPPRPPRLQPPALFPRGNRRLSITQGELRVRNSQLLLPRARFRTWPCPRPFARVPGEPAPLPLSIPVLPSGTTHN